VWSLGAVFHEVLTGERLVKDVDIDADCLSPKMKLYKAKPEYKKAAEVCEKLLKTDPRKRPSAQDLLQSIVSVLPKE
jgi:serine/threonine protein kinase